MEKGIIFLKVLSETVISSSMKKTFMTNQYEEIRKFTTRQGQYCTTGCLLDDEFIKNHYQ